MITEKDFEELKNDQRLREVTANLVKLFQGLELTPSLDMAKIKEEYKVILFQKLMKVDKGAKMRYELHRTEKAKLKMINDFVSLEGYSELDEIQEAIGMYQNAMHSSMLHRLPLTIEQIVADYGCDLVAAAEPFVVRFDLENDVNYQQLKQIENIVNGWVTAGVLPDTRHRRPLDVVRDLIPVDFDQNKVVIDEVRAYRFFKKVD